MDSPIEPGPNPPEWMQAGDSSLADGARKRVPQVYKKRSSHFSISFVAGKEGKGKGKARIPTPPRETEPFTLEFRDKRNANDEECKSDQFKWAVLYEHQRGITVFSTAYYSSRSLLPNDPPPFTVPDCGQSSPYQRPHNASNVTLATYPLPNPTWRWVSQSWLVDMRGDGEVQHDGFEYNWCFRRNHWRTQVGWFSAGGYVRRRRWVRLMMRPSEARLQAEAAFKEDENGGVTDEPGLTNRQSADSRVWRGDDGDWNRVRKVLMGLARDGPRLDLWRDWLSILITASPPSEETQLTEGDFPGSSPNPQKETTIERPQFYEHPPREWILAVLREHGRDLRSCFVYPDSRAQLCDILEQAGLAQDFRNLGPYLPSSRESSSSFLGPGDFWSRSSGLNFVARASNHEKTRS